MTVKYDDEKGKKPIGAKRGKVSGKGTVATKEGKVKHQEKDDRPAAQRKGVHKTPSQDDNVNEANNSYSHQRVEDIQGGYFGVYGNNGRKNEKGKE